MNLVFQMLLEICILLAFVLIGFLLRDRVLQASNLSRSRLVFYGVILLFIPFVLYLFVVSVFNIGAYDVANCPWYELTREPCTVFEFLQLRILLDTLVGLPLYSLYVLLVVVFFGVRWYRSEQTSKDSSAP